MEIHPVADLFPMLADDELKDLAADIAERGLLQPIVLDVDGRILDGRNRYAACAIAGVEPEFVTYDGDDPGGYAVAVNIARRHLTKGQQAMVLVKAEDLHNLCSQSGLARDTGIPQQRFSQAKTILEFAPDLADAVIDGSEPLSKAYEVAQKRKRASETTEARMARLQAEDGELAALVIEERLTLDEAIRTLDDRIRKQRDHAARVSGSLRHLIRYCHDGLTGGGLREEYARIYSDQLGDTPPFPVDADTIRAAADALQALADQWKETRG